MAKLRRKSTILESDMIHMKEITEMVEKNPEASIWWILLWVSNVKFFFYSHVNFAICRGTIAFENLLQSVVQVNFDRQNSNEINK